MKIQTGTRLKIPVIIVLLLTMLLLATSSAYADGDRCWKELVVDVDKNGNLVETKVYGYNVYSKNFGQAFVLCDPSTGEETGEAYIPGRIVGTREVERVKKYEKKNMPDWEHPIELKPVKVTIRAVNIPTGYTFDAEKYKQDGTIREIARNELAWMSSYSWSYLVPDEAGWLIIAELTNPNNVKIKVKGDISVGRWRYNCHSSLSYGSMDKNVDTEFGPNEKKYILLNEGSHPEKYDLFAQRAEQGDNKKYYPGYSTARYDLKIEASDPNYPDILIDNGNKYYYDTYVPFDGTNPTVHPAIPMKPCYEFRCYGSGRGFSITGWAKGRAIYNTELEKWEVTGVEGAAKDALTALFNNWGLMVPFRSSWNWDNDYITAKNGGSTFYFDYLQPVHCGDLGLPSLGGHNNRWGGWRSSDSSPYIKAWDYPAPGLVNYSNRDTEANREAVKICNNNCMPKGAYEEKVRSCDPRYYDVRWMDIFPVVKAEIMFIERWKFVKINADEGYLVKEVVPGQRVYVDNKASRPVIKRDSRLLSIEATGVGTGRNGRVECKYTWTPEKGLVEDYSKLGSGAIKNQWTVKVKYSDKVTAENKLDTSVKWYSSGGDMTFGNHFIDSMPKKIKSTLSSVSMKETDFDGSHFTGRELSLGANEVREVFNGTKESTMVFTTKSYKNSGEDCAKRITELLEELGRKMEKDKEDTFGEGVRFCMSRSYKPEQGGIVGGAKRYLIHGWYEYNSKDKCYEWKRNSRSGNYYWDRTIVGFPGASDLTLMSYLQKRSPTRGVIVTLDNPILSQLRRGSTEIYIRKGYYGSHQICWRHCYDGEMFPKERPSR
jgi:hypothetical protein